MHGIHFSARAAARNDVLVGTFRASHVAEAAQTFEGHTQFTLSGCWHEERRNIPAGSLLIPIAQAKSRLIVALLEPEAPDSYASWGFFATSFERKEYMEDYVIEQVAHDLLARDPALAAEFARRVDSDPQLAKDPQARLDFFYRRHPAWDERYELYPIYRLESRMDGGA